MSYLDTIRTLGDDAEQLELAYQAARKTGETAAFQEAIDASHAVAPGHLLYAAWYYRLAHAAAAAKGFAIAWAWAIPLAALNGLLFWWLSDDTRFMLELANPFTGDTYRFLPIVALLAAPIAAICMVAYLAIAGRRSSLRAAAVAALLAVAVLYVLWVYPQAGPRPFQEQYLGLMILHLLLLSWAGLGLFSLAGRRQPAQRFAFLLKSLEVFVMGGLFAIAGGLFTAVTFGLFAALDVHVTTPVQRLFIAGGGGMIPVLALAVLYNPTRSPAEQDCEEGLSRLLGLLLRVLLPLSLLVLVVYLGFIPFNFRQPFENRDVLINYNAMLFAVMALMAGAAPLQATQLSLPMQAWLRRGVIALAALALIVGLYAFAAILYRTFLDKLTPNRLAFIGWNVINIGLLILILLLQARTRAEAWLHALQRAFSAGALAYVAWTLAMILVLPWLFGVNQGAMQALPTSVQRVVYEKTPPILLKCAASPHIYLLEAGEKRWIKDIRTFDAQGYVWRDVNFISCDDLRGLPDGSPIPRDAGPPPQP